MGYSLKVGGEMLEGLFGNFVVGWGVKVDQWGQSTLAFSFHGLMR
jgi:hypothetical protein